MTRILTAAILIALCGSAMGQPCTNNAGIIVCDIPKDGVVTIPRNIMAQSMAREAHQRKLQSCMVELSTIADPVLRRWCLAQSRRMP